MEQFKDEFDFVEKVKNHTRLSETELLRIGYMVLKEGKSMLQTSREIKVGEWSVWHLFNLHKKYKRKKSSTLSSKEWRMKNRDKARAYSREFYKKNKNTPTINEKKKSKSRAVTALIREYKKESTKRQKHIWKGEGNWSKRYVECVECNSNLYRHSAHGLCYLCYGRVQVKENPSYKKRPPKTPAQAKKARDIRKKRLEEIKHMIDGGQIQVTPKINNILDHIR